MARRMGAEQARQHFAEIIANAEKGGVTIIERHGKPRAMVVPMTRAPVSPASVSFTALAGTGAGLWGSDPARTIEELREEWE